MRRPVQAVIVQGVMGGILAGLVVALWFLVVDVLVGHPFRTPTLLAGVLLHREFPQATFRLVAAYSVLHFGVFALLGVAMAWVSAALAARSEEHTSELQSLAYLVCRLLLEKKKDAPDHRRKQILSLSHAQL